VAGLVSSSPAFEGEQSRSEVEKRTHGVDDAEGDGTSREELPGERVASRCCGRTLCGRGVVEGGWSLRTSTAGSSVCMLRRGKKSVSG